MNYQVYANYEALSLATAELIAKTIKEKPNACICVASGDSPRRTYQILAEWVKSGNLDLSQCQFVGLDEWVGMNQYDEGSCSFYLYRDFFNPAGVQPSQIHYFDAKATDLEAECKRIDNLIFDAGGLDLILVGVGLNGHIALNEPNTPFSNYCHVSILAEITKEVGQKYFQSNTILEKGITVGLRHLREAKKAVLVANGRKKAVVIEQTIRGVISETFPASIMQTLSNGYVWVDAEASQV